MIDIRCCDNLDLMAEIGDSSIDLIYCDVLYGTGRNFYDYQDLRPIYTEIKNHYMPRIKEMHRILKDTGGIYLQMDTRINHWMRCIMDDIFGYNNFRNEIVWHYKTAGRRNNKNYKNDHDCILFYGKEKHILKEFMFLEKIDNNYTGYCKDDFGWYQLTGVGDYSNISLEKLKLENKLHINSKGKPYLKIYLTEIDGVLFKEKKLSDVWLDIGTFGRVNKELKSQKINYQTQKPKKLIERIIKASSNECDLVADFYLGSGTTAEVCKDLNRNFIGCDINPKAIEIAKKRVEGKKWW